MDRRGDFPSPNCGPRRHGGAPDMVVLHYTAMATAQDAIARLCDPCTEVSAHYVIAESGNLTSLVEEADRAWHAGAGAWGNVCDVNSHSIGIELANGGPESDAPAFPETQMQALEGLLAALLQRWSIPPERVIGHSDMAPGRKFDPGPCFDWRRLAAKGLSVWPDAVPVAADWRQFQNAARLFGYRTVDDLGWQNVLEAFRLRFHPDASGPLTGQDVGTIKHLAQKYPCRS
ncbi:MAG: N-acetylmuramoyl-L-alanine amidase [Rhodobacteraceae bacterium]|nr:N-acetylmuramoyl-L-alanine amidase [Paracoccaceae bacterium]